MGCIKLEILEQARDETLEKSHLKVVKGLKSVEKNEKTRISYLSYGMTMPRRSYSSGSQYRFGFQGQEADDEIKGTGNSWNYKYRMHDARIGRFFATDPLEPIYSYNSPYAFSENQVIAYVELEGLEKVRTITLGRVSVPALRPSIRPSVRPGTIPRRTTYIAPKNLRYVTTIHGKVAVQKGAKIQFRFEGQNYEVYGPDYDQDGRPDLLNGDVGKYNEYQDHNAELAEPMRINMSLRDPSEMENWELEAAMSRIANGTESIEDRNLQDEFNKRLASGQLNSATYPAVSVSNLSFGKNFEKKVRKHINQVRNRLGTKEEIPSPGKGGAEKVQQIIQDRISQGGGYAGRYAGEKVTFFEEGKVVYVVRENGEFWTILNNTKSKEDE